MNTISPRSHGPSSTHAAGFGDSPETACYTDLGQRAVSRLSAVEIRRPNQMAWNPVGFVIQENKLAGAGHKLEVILTEKCGPVSGYRLVFQVEFPVGREIRVHHHALPRFHSRMTLPAAQSLGEDILPRTNYASPRTYERPVGHQDNALHNAFVAFQPEGTAWLCAPLAERYAKIGYCWRLLDDHSLEVSVEAEFAGLLERQMPDIEPFYWQAWSEPVVFGPGLFEDYHAALKNAGIGRMHSGPLSRHELFWGTWNEGIHRAIDHELVMTEARFLAKEFPRVRWIQIDDGYHANAATGYDQSGAKWGTSDLGAHYTDESAWCRLRFPRGMRALADEIRAEGLRPMIWFSPSCTIDRALYREHPEWFLPGTRLHFVNEFALPDFSRPEVRDLTCRALDRLFNEWGFEGVKLDFWTYPFMQPGNPSFANGGKTGHEWAAWLENEIRARVGPEGLMLSCLEPAAGDPLRSIVWDAHRVGPDISGGLALKTFEEIAIAVAAQHGLKQTQRAFWMADADGLSVYRAGTGADDAKWSLITAFLVASGSALEIAGRLSKQTTDSRYPALHRAISVIRHGQEINCPGYDWTENHGRAPLVWERRDTDGGRVLGVTNWRECPYPLRMDFDCVDLFTGKPVSGGASVSVAPGSGGLWATDNLI